MNLNTYYKQLLYKKDKFSFEDYIHWNWYYLVNNKSKKDTDKQAFYKSLRRKKYAERNWKVNYRFYIKTYMVEHHWAYYLYELLAFMKKKTGFSHDKLCWYFYEIAKKDCDIALRTKK